MVCVGGEKVINQHLLDADCLSRLRFSRYVRKSWLKWPSRHLRRSIHSYLEKADCSMWRTEFLCEIFNVF